MRFEFATAARIIFGAGTLSEVGPITALMSGRHVMQVICKQDKRPFVTTVP